MLQLRFGASVLLPRMVLHNRGWALHLLGACIRPWWGQGGISPLPLRAEFGGPACVLDPSPSSLWTGEEIPGIRRASAYVAQHALGQVPPVPISSTGPTFVFEGAVGPVPARPTPPWASRIVGPPVLEPIRIAGANLVARSVNSLDMYYNSGMYSESNAFRTGQVPTHALPQFAGARGSRANQVYLDHPQQLINYADRVTNPSGGGDA